MLAESVWHLVLVKFGMSLKVQDTIIVILKIWLIIFML